VSDLVKVCTASELGENEALRVDVAGAPVAIVKDAEGAIFAIGDTCTHGDISLSEGFVEGDTLECWAHGSKFELKSGKPLNFPAYEPVPVFAVSVVDGDVFVDPTPRTPESL
jgi:3-phenylpropionate/trans-cinnamate dioxygenase ferredoxin subunit